MNYEEKYKKALEIANAKIETYYHLGNTSVAKSIEEIFPELKESEDEKIRKELIRAFTVTADKRDYEIYGNGITYRQVLAWLEKQGEHKCDCEYVGCHVNNVKRWCHKKQSEIPYEKCNAKCSEYLKQGEQKPAWSEEDEPQKELAEIYLAVFDEKFPILPTLKGKQLADYKNFLNKCQQILGLKYWSLRPLQAKLFEKLSLLWAAWGAEHLKGLGQTNGDTDNEKQEWSEEDEDNYDTALWHIKHSSGREGSVYNWLKSLKERIKGE